MSIKIKKKLVKTTIIILLLIIVVLSIVALIIGSYYFVKIKNAEKRRIQKFSEISVEELKEKIIEELKNTELNLEFTLFEGTENEISVVTDINEPKKGVIKEIDDYVCAIVYVSKQDELHGVVIPCFKLEEDNGKLKSITYLIDENVGSIVNESVEKVFRKEYGIDLLNYYQWEKTNSKTLEILSTDSSNKLIELVCKRITGEDIKDNTLQTITYDITKKR